MIHWEIVEDSSSRSTESEELNIQIKETSGSWWRIIKLGKQEWKFYIIGFFFLLIASSSKFIFQTPNNISTHV